jgi:lipopolysaccharide/colanic/teichoic acid biosynthesis glycosyltransferase
MKVNQLLHNGTGVNMVGNVSTLRTERRYRLKTNSMNMMKLHYLYKYQWWKGVIDKTLAVLVLVISSPFMALIALAVRIDSPGNAIYRRIQVGEKGRQFTAYKFRTMYDDNDDREYKNYIKKYIKEDAPYTVSDNGQKVYKVVNDPRVTRFGAILRRTNLDELPQFINVLKGEMSIVGPRPDIPYAVDMYKPWHRKRLAVKPGITGLWQTCSRKERSFKGMVRLDIKYIKRQSLLLDIKILILTLVTILKRDGS